jgi:hypothetical protein
MSLPSTGNTVPYKFVWINAYEETHYKQPVFPVFADTRFADSLPVGASIKWSYDADIDANGLGLDGSYTVEGRTVTDETLTVNQLPSAVFRIPAPQKIQDHRPTQEKWATKAMNRIFWKMDAQMLVTMAQNAYSVVDASDPIAGSGAASGTPLTVSTANAPAIFAAARMKLRNTNVIYDENKKWTGYVKLDTMAKYPCCAIPAELEAPLLLAIGFKPGDVGDGVLVKGFINLLFGFNTFVSTALPYSCLLTVQAGSNIANNTTVTIGGSGTYGVSGGIVFNFVTGSPTNPGDIKADASHDYTSLANLMTACAAPYTAVSNIYVPFVRLTGTIYQRQILDGLANSVQASTLQGTASATSNTATLAVYGQGALNTVSSAAQIVVSNQAVHAIFGTSQSIALVMQRYPELQVSGDIIGNGSTGGMVAKDFVTWTLAGWQVFKTHTYQLVDVPIACSTFTSPLNVYL